MFEMFPWEHFAVNMQSYFYKIMDLHKLGFHYG